MMTIVSCLGVPGHDKISQVKNIEKMKVFKKEKKVKVLNVMINS